MLLSFCMPTIAHDITNENVEEKEQLLLLEADSVLENCYYTEKAYNRLHGISSDETICDSQCTYEDEIYSGKKYRKRTGNIFFRDIPAELVVDVVLNTLFFVSVLWE